MDEINDTQNLLLCFFILKDFKWTEKLFASVAMLGKNYSHSTEKVFPLIFKGDYSSDLIEFLGGTRDIISENLIHKVHMHQDLYVRALLRPIFSSRSPTSISLTLPLPYPSPISGHLEPEVVLLHLLFRGFRYFDYLVSACYNAHSPSLPQCLWTSWNLIL